MTTSIFHVKMRRTTCTIILSFIRSPHWLSLAPLTPACSKTRLIWSAPTNYFVNLRVTYILLKNRNVALSIQITAVSSNFPIAPQQHGFLVRNPNQRYARFEAIVKLSDHVKLLHIPTIQWSSRPKLWLQTKKLSSYHPLSYVKVSVVPQIAMAVNMEYVY